PRRSGAWKRSEAGRPRGPSAPNQSDRADRAPMRNIKLTLSYDGTDFSGWQRQPDLRTVQQVLEGAIGRLTGTESTTTASGRTDAGVHALGQVVHFFSASRLAPEVFVKALNALLPPDVRVLSAEEVPQAFHATLDAKAKLYRYVIDNGPIADPF